MSAYYCGMCEKWFRRGGDCKLCGFKLEKAPEPPAVKETPQE